MTLYEKTITRNPSGLDENERLFEAYQKVLNERTADPEQKEVAKQVKALYKKLGLKARVNSSPGKGGWIKSYLPGKMPYGEEQDGIIPADLRNLALDIIYSPSFKRDREKPNAGNVAPNGISMSWPEWKELLSLYK